MTASPRKAPTVGLRTVWSARGVEREDLWPWLTAMTLENARRGAAEG